MKFAIFYEIPVARPWTRDKERAAFQNVVEQAVLAEKLGFHSFWTVEHHFLEEFSHCSNPEVLYGAIAARTKTLRIGYGVRLMPKPYNHPVRTAESVAVLDLISGGRVEFGTGRSVTRDEMEGFGIHPNETRAMWAEAVEHVIGCWTNEYHSFDGKYWSMPRRCVLPKPYQEPHPPVWAASTSIEGHREIGRKGLGCCSFIIGFPPEAALERSQEYRRGVAECTQPVGKFINNRFLTVTMMHCAETSQEAYDVSGPSMAWYGNYARVNFGKAAQWMHELMGKDLGTYSYADNLGDLDANVMTFEGLRDSGSVIVGDPERCLEGSKRFAEAGVDILALHVNPYAIPHEQVMSSLELFGTKVLPKISD